MITRQDVLEAIAECQGTRAPNANTAIKLAAFYTILDHIDESKSETPMQNSYSGYSYDEPPEGIVQYNGDSDFARAIKGKQQSEVWAVIDELMDIVRAMNERLYDGVMRRLR